MSEDLLILHTIQVIKKKKNQKVNFLMFGLHRTYLNKQKRSCRCESACYNPGIEDTQKQQPDLIHCNIHLRPKTTKMFYYLKRTWLFYVYNHSERNWLTLCEEYHLFMLFHDVQIRPKHTFLGQCSNSRAKSAMNLRLHPAEVNVLQRILL